MCTVFFFVVADKQSEQTLIPLIVSAAGCAITSQPPDLVATRDLRLVFFYFTNFFLCL